MDAAALDAADPLAPFAARFRKRPDEIYLDGNSLGLPCDTAEVSLRVALDAWRELAIRGWTDGPDPWFEMSRKAAGLLAGLLGADVQDVMVGGSTTVNLHQLLASFSDPWRSGVLIDGTAFPSDRYAVQSHLKQLGLHRDLGLRVVPAEADGLLSEDRILAAMDEDIGFAVLPAVVYTTGQLLDVARLDREATARRVLVAWDCSHSAGVVRHDFARDRVRLAFGCGYKWLNGGPGAVGWLYARAGWREAWPGLAGWFGCDPARQFEMATEFHPAPDAGRFQIGTPHVFSLAPLLGSLPVLADAGIDRIRAKSLDQTAFLRRLVAERLTRFGVRVVTPLADHKRGGHLALAHPDAGRLSRALRQRGVIPDHRPPDLLRLAPAPLYTSFAECERAVGILEDILATGSHQSLGGPDARVT